MNPEIHTPRPAGGDGLLLAIATALVLVVTVEAAFVVIGGWALMIATFVLVLVAAGAVIGALMHTMNDDSSLAGH
jgi:hypothetical protein